MINPQIVEDRIALVPVIGKLVSESLRQPGIAEEVIRYGTHPQQVALIFWPELPEVRRRSAVLFIHGGGWNTGSPLFYRFMGHFFARQGFPVVLAGYRLAPAAVFPSQLQDVYAGLEAGLQALAGQGVSVRQVIVGGQSAGAQLAALLVYDRSCMAAGPEHLGGFYAISGPLSFEECAQPELRKMISDFMGESAWALGDPIRHLQGDESVPALLIHGDRDPLVEPANSLAFARRLSSNLTCPVDVYLVPGGRHADLASAFVELQPMTLAFTKWLAHVD